MASVAKPSATPVAPVPATPRPQSAAPATPTPTLPKKPHRPLQNADLVYHEEGTLQPGPNSCSPYPFFKMTFEKGRTYQVYLTPFGDDVDPYVRPVNDHQRFDMGRKFGLEDDFIEWTAKVTEDAEIYACAGSGNTVPADYVFEVVVLR